MRRLRFVTRPSRLSVSLWLVEKLVCRSASAARYTERCKRRRVELERDALARMLNAMGGDAAKFLAINAPLPTLNLEPNKLAIEEVHPPLSSQVSNLWRGRFFRWWIKIPHGRKAAQSLGSANPRISPVPTQS